METLSGHQDSVHVHLAGFSSLTHFPWQQQITGAIPVHLPIVFNLRQLSRYYDAIHFFGPLHPRSLLHFSGPTVVLHPRTLLLHASSDD